MSIYPTSLNVIAPLPVISPLSANALPFIARDNGASAAYPTANKAIFVPFRISVPYIVRRLWLLNGGTTTGTVDVAIYTKSFVRMTFVGAQTQSGASAIQSFTIPDLILAPGTFYLAVSASATTDHMFRLNPWPQDELLRISGVLEQASAHPLPAVATPQGITVAYLPIFGCASRTFI